MIRLRVVREVPWREWNYDNLEMAGLEWKHSNSKHFKSTRSQTKHNWKSHMALASQFANSLKRTGDSSAPSNTPQDYPTRYSARIDAEAASGSQDSQLSRSSQPSTRRLLDRKPCSTLQSQDPSSGSPTTRPVSALTRHMACRPTCSLTPPST